MKSRSEPARIAILVYDGVEPIDVGATFGVLSMAKRVLPYLEITTVAEVGAQGVVTLANGLRMVADHGYEDCPVMDVLIVCGGPGWEMQAANGPTIEFLRAVFADTIASVCTGAMILAAAGLLNGVPAATTRRMAAPGEAAAPLARLAEQFPDMAACEAVLVDTGRIITGGGVSLAADTTLHLLARLYGAEASKEVATLIEYDRAAEVNYQTLGIVVTP